MAPIDDISGMNYNFNISYGNQIKYENGHSFGYLGSLSTEKNNQFMKTHRITFSTLVLTVRTIL